MTKSLLTTIVLFLIFNPLFSQKLIHGYVLEEKTKRSVPYANIGILNSSIGTISNEDGSYSINIPAELSEDTILFSAIGYTTLKVPLSSLMDKQLSPIFLSEEQTLLDTVTVSAAKKKRKTYWLGNKYYRGGNIYADSISGGSAMALLIENKYPSHHKDLTFPVYLEKAQLRIASNTFTEFKIRIRLLDYDTLTRLPGNDLLNENVIVTSGIKNGWLNIDLTPYKFRVEKPFFVMFEWIMEDDDRQSLMDQYVQFKKLHPEKVTVDTMLVRGEKVPYTNWHDFIAGTFFGVSPLKFSLDNYLCYYRNNSFGEWKKASTILTAKILVSNLPAKIVVKPANTDASK